jgi:hypothetical protein
VRVLGDFARHVVADDRVQASDQHERLVEQGRDPALVGLEALDQVRAEAGHAVCEKTRRVKQVRDHDGLEDVELEVTLAASEGDGSVVAEDLGAEHGEGLALGRVDFAGHDGAAGLILRELELGEAVELAVRFDDGVVGGEGLKLVGCGDELGAGHLGDFLGDALGKALEAVEAGADSGAALGQHAQTGKG